MWRGRIKHPAQLLILLCLFRVKGQMIKYVLGMKLWIKRVQFATALFLEASKSIFYSPRSDTAHYLVSRSIVMKRVQQLFCAWFLCRCTCLSYGAWSSCNTLCFLCIRAQNSSVYALVETRNNHIFSLFTLSLQPSYLDTFHCAFPLWVIFAEV